MRNGRRAALAALALLLGLLVPQAAHAAGTSTARVATSSSDALPAARPALRPHADAVSAPDALAPDTPPAPPSRGDTDRTSPHPSGPGRAAGAPQARGPPQG